MKREDIRILGVAEEDPFHYQTWSGSSAYLFNALRQSEHLYTAVSADPPQFVNAVHKVLSFHPNLNAWRFRYHTNVRHYEQRTRSAMRAISALDDTGYDVILQIGAWFNLAKRKDKVTVSYHDGNLSALLKSPFGAPSVGKRWITRALSYERTFYHDVDHIFTMSRWLADSFRSDFGVPASKLSPVGAGINLPYTTEINTKSYDNKRILFVGKDFERKGGYYLLEAFRLVRCEIKDATLTIIGPRLAALPEGVTCLNYVSKFTPEGLSELMTHYVSASVFVLPSLYEPFGISLAEAMAHKLPCVGTNICAIPEIIDDKVTGLVVPVRDAKTLAKRLIGLLKDPLACKELGDRGFKKYQTDYTWDAVVKKMVECMTHFV